MARLPQPGGDDNTWGDILNGFLLQTLNEDGSLRDGSIAAKHIQAAAITSDKIASVSPSQVTGLSASLQAKADAATTVKNAGGVSAIWKGTQAEYDALTTHDNSTLYIIVAAGGMNGM